MRNYELINLLGEAKATEKVKVHICLSLQELMNGEQIDKVLYSLPLGGYELECETCVISTSI